MSGQTPPSPTPSPVPEEKKKATDYASMVETTMAQDIDTANYYELVAWCRLLGLDESGDKPALVQKLKNHFKIQAGGEKKEILKRIQIKSARSSEYFSLEDAKEDYVLIQGNAVIVLTDTKDNTTHTIQAERVLYNQTKNTISASGNVLYTRKIGDKEEAFTGETFVFDVENWEGVLYYAQGERMKKMEEKEVLFRYSGKTVTRLKDNSILLEDGVITSSLNIDHPHYRITASRIWVYGPGEWAIENAVLYIGNIPSLYIPFYFYSSDEIFFNPVVGIRLREGAFLQNTLYLIGKKTREDDALSFLQLEESSSQDYEMKLDGLFLRPVRTQTAAASAATPAGAVAAAEIKHFKLFLDVYSRLGGFTGVSLDASPAFKLYGGIGVSRSIFYIPPYGYTSFFQGQNYWNSGYFFNIPTPFRFGLEMEFNTSAGILTKLSGSIKLFSDPYFPTDFYTRQESLDLGKMLGFDLSSQTVPATTVVTTGQQQNISWRLDLALNFATLVKSPLFQTLKIEPFNVTFDWASKSKLYSIPPVTPAEIIIAADPARMFYYPYRLTFPNFTVGVGGTIFTYTASNEVAAAKPVAGQPAGGGPDIRPPVAAQAPPSPEATPLPDYFGLRKPETKTDSPIDRTMKYFSVNTSYGLSRSINVVHQFNDAAWTNLEDITYYTSSSIFDLKGTSSLNYAFSILNATLNLNGNFTLLDKYKTTFIPFQGFSQTLSDTSLTGLDLTKNLTAIYSPFKPYTDFSSTNLSYTLKWDFYDIYALSGVYYDRLLQFNRDTVNTQKVSASFIYQPEDKANSLVMSANIPPVLGLIQADLNFYIWIFQTTISGGYRETLSGSWIFDPLRINEKVEYEKYFSINSTYTYDPETKAAGWNTNAYVFKYKYLDKDRYLFSQELEYQFAQESFQRSVTSIDLWNLTASMRFQYLPPVNALGTQISPTPEFLLQTCSLSYYYDLPHTYFWRNRGSFSASINTRLTLNFQKIVDSNFTLGLKLNFKIHQFVEIVFSTEVYNNNIYRYIPPFVDNVNQALVAAGILGVTITPVNPFEDLLRSFNFFNTEDRFNSFFKLEKLGLSLIHHLDDWDFTIEFSGAFKNTYNTSTGVQSYEWLPTVTFSLKWLGIPQIKKDVSDDGTANGLKVN